MGTLSKLFAILTLFFFCSCEEQPTNPNLLPNPGTGSNTLLVQGEVEGEDSGPGSYITRMAVTVRDSLGLAVVNASVSIVTPAHGTISLIHNTTNPGTYEASLNDYNPGLYTLNVIRGSDNLLDVREIGPDIHNITFPTSSDTLAADSAFNLVWTRSSKADTAEIETKDFGPALTSDDGLFTVPPSLFPRNDQRIRVRRANEINAAGGLNSSYLKVSIRKSVEPIVVQ